MAELPEGLPAVIRIGPKDYAIIAWTPHYSGDQNRHGEFSSTLCEIRVCFEGRPRRAVAITLLHEITHGCYYEACLEDEDKEERIVDALSTVFAGALRDSPDVFAWIAKAVR